MVVRARVPPGLSFLRSRVGPFSFQSLQTSVLCLTFFAYVCYHASRKPPSVVKGVLDPYKAPNVGIPLPFRFSWPNANPRYSSNLNATHLWPYERSLETWATPAARNSSGEFEYMITGNESAAAAGWPPFSGKYGKSLLGELDLAFLMSYAVGMYFSGQVGDRMDLRIYLSCGMLGSGFFVCLFGMGYFWNVHSLPYFLFVQMAAGLLQATGWPSVVAIMANWFGKKGRGLILGIWNAHTSVGNITGSLVASLALSLGWGWAFLFPGIGIMLGGIVVFLFLAPEPEIMGLESPHSRANFAQGDLPDEEEDEGLNAENYGDVVDGEEEADTEAESQLIVKIEEELEDGLLLTGDHSRAAIGFFSAWKIPGVAAFAFSLFFAKLVAYTFLYWLPFYISHTSIGGKHLSDSMAGITSTVFDIGGVLGGVLAGHLADISHSHAIVSASFTLIIIPTLAVYYYLGSISLLVNILLLSLVGFFVNGPYALITCAVSADLGQHPSLKGNAKALATVTAIIDGTGSMGAALGPLLTGFLAQFGGAAGWEAVFGMLMVSALASVLCILRLVRTEAAVHFGIGRIESPVPVRRRTVTISYAEDS